MNFSIIQKKPKDSQLFILGDVKELKKRCRIGAKRKNLCEEGRRGWAVSNY